ncbi:MAG: glycosyltransferase [Brevinema sp.]
MYKLISIIIPVYNTDKYLSKCLDSLFMQSFQDFEIILVNDASQDNSQRIIDEYAQKDSRIRSFIHETNQGTHETRRTGILHAQGQFCVFLDSDDLLTPDTLKALANLINEKSPDYIQFRLVKSTSEEIRQYSYPLYGEDIFKTLFVCNSFFSWSAGGSCISTELLKRALEEIPRARITHSEDFLLAYIYSFFAKHYEFCHNATYVYCIHDENSDAIDLNNPVAYQKWIANFKTVYSSLDAFKEKYQINQQYPVSKIEHLHDYIITNFFMFRVQLSDLSDKFIEFCDALGAERIFDIFYRYYSPRNLLHLLPFSKPVKKPHSIKTIAVILDNLGIGGVERVASLLIKQLVQEGYKVYLFIDDITDHHMDIPDSIIIVHCPKHNFFSFINQKIKEYNIDLIHVHNYWKERDLLLLIYTQFKDVFSVCSIHGGALWMICEGANPIRYHDYHACADAVTVLSQSDQRYLQQTSTTPHIYIPNLLTFDPDSCSSTLEDNQLLFIGRFEDQKNPKLLIRAFKKVIQFIPTVQLTMVGDGKLFNECKQLIKSLNLSQNIKLEGAQKDVAPYLQKASLLVLPSQYEGFPIVVTEAMSYGIPVLMSHLSYCELCYCDGVVTFNKNSEQELSNTIINLLKDKQTIQNLSKQVKESVKQFDNNKTTQRWIQLFNGISKQKFSEELLHVEQKVPIEKINNIYNQEFYQQYYIDGIRVPKLEITYPKKITIHSSLQTLKILKLIIKKLVPQNSFQYRILRKYVILLLKVIKKTSKFLDIKI